MDESASGIPAVPSVPVSKRSLRLWLAGALVLILTAVLALWLGMRMREQQAPIMLESQLTAYEGFESEPAFSPDGNQVAFVWNRDGVNSDIYLRLIGAGQPVQLTSTPELESSPAWSPDGRWIAFLRSTSPNANAALFVIPSIGGAEHKIAESGTAGVIVGTVRWSPHSEQLLVSGTIEKDDRIGLLLIDFNTREKRRLTSCSSAVFRPRRFVLAGWPADWIPAPAESELPGRHLSVECRCELSSNRGAKTARTRGIADGLTCVDDRRPRAGVSVQSCRQGCSVEG